MNWAKQRSEDIARPWEGVIALSAYDALVDRIAAELQRVADECAEVVEKAPLKGRLRGGCTYWRGPLNFAADIRAKFPKENV